MENISVTWPCNGTGWPCKGLFYLFFRYSNIATDPYETNKLNEKSYFEHIRGFKDRSVIRPPPFRYKATDGLIMERWPYNGNRRPWPYKV